MISSSVYLVSILGFALKATAQCVTAGYVPCLVPGSGGAVAPPPISPYGSGSYGGFGSGLWSSIQGVATSPIQKRDLEDRSPAEDGYTEIEKRQNSLCCRPAPVECLHANGIPFCYNPATTRLFFSDGSYAYTSNDTYYGSDGTFIDYKNGIYQYPNGTTIDFTPTAGSAATTSAGSSAPTTPAVVDNSGTTATGSIPKGTGTATAATGGSGGSGTTPGASASTPSASKSAGGKVENAMGVLVSMFGLMAAFF